MTYVVTITEGPNEIVIVVKDAEDIYNAADRAVSRYAKGEAGASGRSCTLVVKVRTALVDAGAEAVAF